MGMSLNSSTEQYDNDSWWHQQHRAVWQWFMTSAAQSSMTMIHGDISGTQQYDNDSWWHQRHRAVWQWFMTLVSHSSMTVIHDISVTEQYDNDYDISVTEQYDNDYGISGTEQYNNDSWHQHYRKSMYYYDNDSWHELTVYRTMPTDTVKCAGVIYRFKIPRWAWHQWILFLLMFCCCLFQMVDIVFFQWHRWHRVQWWNRPMPEGSNT